METSSSYAAGKAFGEPVGELAAFELAARLDQCVAQPIAPGAHGLRDQRLERVGIDGRRLSPRYADDHVDARQRRIRQLHLRFDRRRVQLLLDHRLDALADLRVVAVARHEDESGIETTERVPAQEHAHALALVQIDDAAHDANQLGARSTGTARRADTSPARASTALPSWLAGSRPK